MGQRPILRVHWGRLTFAFSDSVPPLGRSIPSGALAWILTDDTISTSLAAAGHYAVGGAVGLGKGDDLDAAQPADMGQLHDDPQVGRASVFLAAGAAVALACEVVSASSVVRSGRWRCLHSLGARRPDGVRLAVAAVDTPVEQAPQDRGSIRPSV